MGKTVYPSQFEGAKFMHKMNSHTSEFEETEHKHDMSKGFQNLNVCSVFKIC